jgi:hypothetical protein
MEALIGNGLVLNDQDLIVDTDLPTAKQKYNITPTKDAKDDVLAAGAEFRSSALVTVKSKQESLQDEEHQRKIFIKKNWDAAKDIQKQEFLNKISDYKLPEYKELIDYIKAERAWWKSDYSKGLAKFTLQSVLADFNDELSDKTKKYEKALDANKIKNQELVDKRKKEGFVDWDNMDAEEATIQNAVANENIDPFKRTVWDDVNESWLIIGGYLGSLIWIILGLRFGSSIANEYFYLQTGYKILMFVYTFIFTPALIPYFIYKTLRTFFFPATYPPVTFRCFLPLFETNDEKLAGSWFTYFLDEATIAEKYKKLEAIKEAKIKVLEKTIMEPLKIELEKITFLSAHPTPKGC